MQIAQIEPKKEGLLEIVGEVWAYRELLYQFTLRDIRIRYKQAVMGFAWAMFLPFLIVLSGMLVRFAMARLSGGELEREVIAVIAVKALPWAFFVGAVGGSNMSLIGNANLVTKIYFPREVLPLSAVLAQTFDTMVGAIALLFVLPFLGVQLSFALLWVPLLAAVLFLLTFGLALFLSSANLFFRDVKYLVSVILTFGIFFTPVFFEPGMFGEVGARLMMLNPVAPILEAMRLSMVDGNSLLAPIYTDGFLVWSPWYLLYSASWAIVGFVGASLMFHRLEFLFAEYA